MKFGYTMQQFSQARRALMMPFHEGEVRAVRHAVYYCKIGLEHMDALPDEDTAGHWISKLKPLLARASAQPEGALPLSSDDLSQLSGLIDELADYFVLECLGTPEASAS